MLLKLLSRKTKNQIPWSAIAGDFCSSNQNNPIKNLFKWPGTKKNFPISEAVRGVQIFGATGSGKTSGSGAYIAQEIISHGIGGLVLTCKKDDYSLWKKFGENTGTSDSFVRIGWDTSHSINIFEFFKSNSDDQENVHIEIADIMKNFFFDREGNESESFWTKSRELLVINIIRALVISNEPITIENIDKIIKELYLLKKKPMKAIFIRSLVDECESLDKYFFDSLPSLADETLSSTILTLEVQLGRYTNSRVGKMFMGETNIDPRIMLLGARIVVDTPVERYGNEGLLINILWKAIFEKMVLKFKDKKSNYTFKWEDEAHNTVSRRDALFNSTSRDKNQINVYCTQGVNNYLLSAGRASDKSVSALLLNIGTKVFHQTTEIKTFELIKDISGTKEVDKRREHKDSENKISITTEKVNEDRIKRDDIISLRKGGKDTRFLVDAFVSQGGSESDILKVTFSQKYQPPRANCSPDFSLLEPKTK